MDSVFEIEHQISILDRNISDFEREELVDLEREHDSLVETLQSLKTSLRHLRYCCRRYKFLIRFRPQSKVRPTGVLICAPLFIAVVVLWVSELWCESIATAFGICVVVYFTSLIVFTIRYVRLLFIPSTDSLPRLIDEHKSSIGIQVDALRTPTKKLGIVLNKLQPLRQQRHSLVCKRDALLEKRNSLRLSIHYRREKLKQRDWKQLRGLGWERYLEEVCNALGYGVEHTKSSGDQGVDLVAVRGEKRIAIQAKGYANKVSNKAVQEVVAGQRIYNCSASAVITNSSFTESAFELAAANRCVLIYDENFPDFVMGRLSLSQ